MGEVIPVLVFLKHPATVLILSPLNIPEKSTYVILQAEGKRIYPVYNTLSRQMSLK